MRGFVALLGLLGVLAAAACATPPGVVVHEFGFDLLRDSPDAELLDYRYGSSKSPGARPDPGQYRPGYMPQQNGISGAMLRGDDLYVKWRDKLSGQVFEKTIDLRSRLPADIYDHRIVFVIGGPRNSEVFVYLVSPERRPPDMAPNGPRIYSYRKVTTIYPDTIEKSLGSESRSRK